MAQAMKKGRSGQRGIKNVDRVNDTEMFCAEYKDENGKQVRLGKIRLAHEINDGLKHIAHDLNTTKAELVRTLFVVFIQDYKEAKATGAIQKFTPAQTIERWLTSRYEFFQLFNELKKQTKYLEDSKSPEVKILSRQISIIAEMLNLTNKNVI